MKAYEIMIVFFIMVNKYYKNFGKYRKTYCYLSTQTWLLLYFWCIFYPKIFSLSIYCRCKPGFWNENSCIQILVLSCASYVSLSKFHNCSNPQFLHRNIWTFLLELQESNEIKTCKPVSLACSMYSINKLENNAHN